jgi:hypothetical protein
MEDQWCGDPRDHDQHNIDIWFLGEPHVVLGQFCPGVESIYLDRFDLDDPNEEVAGSRSHNSRELSKGS